MKIIGLTSNEVLKEIELGNTNIAPKPLVKSNGRIIAQQTLTLFNLYNLVIAVFLLAIKAYSSLFFVLIVVSNIAICAGQEIKSKNIISKLKMIVDPKTKVLRNNEIIIISNDDIVLNDIIYLEAGSQIASDCVVVKDKIEVDESLLTGEVEPINKLVDDILYSGSYVLSGQCFARVVHVGKDNYASQITNEASNRKTAESKLIQTFNRITTLTSYLVVPISFLLVYQGLFVRGDSYNLIVMTTATSLLGMLPKGLVLLTSLSLAAGVVKLGKDKALVQELYSIETLSRVDVLCLDKTGTLTKGEMVVEDVTLLEDITINELDDIMNSFIEGAMDNNATNKTLRDYYNGASKYSVINSIPFSSQRKRSVVELEGVGSIIVGAPEFIIPNYHYSKEINNAILSGARILMVAQHDNYENIDNELPKPLALIRISDSIRDDAKATLKFFKDNDVNIKIISGDNPLTVNAIAKQAGSSSAGKFFDASMISNDDMLEEVIMNYDIIGRATPKQKHKMILVLQKHGNTVAMTGDGVNDVLALKDADISIAMGNGSDVTKQIAHVVVMDENLDTLVEIVKEGRQVINSVTRSASMYYLKTIYTIALSILAIILNIPFPFIPFQITLMDMFISGFPSFMLIFETNITKPKESITHHSLRYSLPNAMAIVFVVGAVTLLAPLLKLDINEVFTIIYFSTAFISLHMIYRIYKPLNIYRGGVLLIDIIGFILSVPIFWKLLELSRITAYLLNIILITIIACIPVLIITRYFVFLYLNKREGGYGYGKV